VPPEAVSPVAELCQKYGMQVSIRSDRIICYKKY
jgi:hypothetical protein